MKKNGFVLAETLIATTLVATVFTVLYLQFARINENYRKTYENNTVESLYATNNIKKFILSNGYYSLNIDTYLDITSCSYFTNQSQCTNLFDTLEVKQVIVSKDDISSLKSSMLDDENISDNLKNFIKIINTDTTDENRLIVEYQNGSCSTIKVG